MLLNQSPRGSFSVPVSITLQGARRRHMRDVSHHQPQLQETGGNWRKEREMKCNEKARAQAPESSVGEDRAILLGLTMMTFSILMYFLVGISVVKPCLQSDWEDSNCSLLDAYFLNESLDCCCITTNYSCLHVLVKNMSSEKELQLHYDEEVVKSNPKCFYTPKSQRNKTELEVEATDIRDALLRMRGESMKCYLSAKYPDDALLRRKYSMQVALYYMLWPSLMFLCGFMLVGLVKFNQHLAFLCNEISREELLGKQSKLTERRVYRLLRCWPGGLTEHHETVS